MADEQFDTATTDLAAQGAQADAPLTEAPAAPAAAAPDAVPAPTPDLATEISARMDALTAKKEPVVAEAPPAAPPAAAPAAAAKPVKKLTGDLEGLDEPPAGVKDAARERYQKLVGAIHTREERLGKAQAELEQLRAQSKDSTERLETWQKYVSGTGASETELATTFTYLQNLHSGDPVRMRAAFDTLQAELSGLSRVLGIKPQNVDPLSAYPDLRQRVDANDISEDTAMEIARLRSTDERTRMATQRAQEAQQQTERSEREATDAQTRIAQTLAGFQKSDPLYSQKIAYLEQSGQLAKIGSSIPPAGWATAVEMAYNGASIISQPRAPANPAPLRPGAVAAPAAARRAPTTLEDTLMNQFNIN